MRGGLHRSYESRTRKIAPEAAKFLRRDDDDFISSMHRDVLRTFVADTSNEFAKACLRVLERPVSGLRRTPPADGFPRAYQTHWLDNSSHADQNIIFASDSKPPPGRWRVRGRRSLRLMVELDEQPEQASSELGGRAVLPPDLERDLEHLSNALHPGVRAFGDRVTL